MKLYEINEQLERLLELDTERMVDIETGEILTSDAVNELKLAKEEKIEGCICFYKGQKAEAEALKAEIEKLALRKKRIENKMEWLKEYISHSLNGEAFSTAKATAKYRKSESVEVNMDTLPEEFKKITFTADKVALKKALKNGDIIKGAELVVKNNIQLS